VSAPEAVPLREEISRVAGEAPAADDPPYVLGLSAVAAGDLGIAGGKAANLGELLRARFPVPPGFVVTTHAYDRVVAANGLEAAIDQVRQAANGEALRAALEAATIPAEVEQAIVAAYRQLGGGSVAVRSSATAEDLPGAAFAGQQDTFLGISGETALLAAIRRCWASLWSERAIAYRARHGFANTDVKLAVVVQRMIAPEAAGVLFTANPITGARNETIIDASPGLGEAVVSGLVTPDHVTLRHGRWGWQAVERRLGRQEVVLRPLAAGGVARSEATGVSGPLLPDRVLRRLARMGSAIARHFGRPQDVEWAWAGGRLYILQARPITALPAAPLGRGPFGRGGPVEYFQVRPYPLDMTTWLPAMGRAIMRMFPIGRSLPSFDQFFREDDGVVTEVTDWPAFRLTPGLFLAPVRMLPLAWRYDPARWRDDPLLARALAQVRDLNARDLSTLSWADLLKTAHEAMAFPDNIVELRRRYFPRTLFAMAGLRLLLGRLGLADRFGALLSGGDNLTLEANRRLETLAAEIRADPALAALFAQREPAQIRAEIPHLPGGPAFLQALRAFLADFGHRETASPLLVSQPTWIDAPEVVLGILQGLAPVASVSPVGPRPWEVARDEVLAHPALRFPPLRAAFLALLTTARRFPPLREDTHFMLTMTMPVLRRTLLELGRRLAAVGVLDTADDVFHLRFEELERVAGSWPPSAELAAEFRSAAERRAQRRAALGDAPLLPLPAPAPSEPASGALVTGTPGSPGTATGRVRVVRDASAFGTLRPGEVLVAPYTNPAWTPLFGRAAAVVVDVGSAVSHAAIVAREYGIPAVMGTGDGTRLLTDGAWVRVDGSRGLVFAAPDADGAAPLAAGLAAN
jgi:pyruvate,water dikinase